MTIRAWDWEKGWKCIQVFEGHSHYVMGMAINPKWVPQLKAARMTVNGKQVSVYDRVMQLKAEMEKGGKFDPFTGPIKDRNGVLRVPAGKVMSVADLNNMAWVAPGVTGQIADEPKK